jgi:UDP-glucose 4-epimerase
MVIGGAGYIGSHMVRRLQREGLNPVVLDNLICGHADAVKDVELIIGDCGDASLIQALFTERPYDCVMHFASFSQVGESMLDPSRYYENNVARTITLLNAMVRHAVPNFIFSSSAAIYGHPQRPLIDEQHPCMPINPYGRSKWMVEQMLEDYHRAYGLRYGCLRYFNAAGAEPDGTLGECHEPETHLIPLALQAASGRRHAVKVFGTDYDTPDGTCIRDYIHVCDLADAHWRLLEKLCRRELHNMSFNLGTGKGDSVKQVIETCRDVSGRDIPLIIEGRRPGDPAVLVADGTMAKHVLGWHPSFSDLPTIVGHAWAWEKKLVAHHVI